MSQRQAEFRDDGKLTEAVHVFVPPCTRTNLADVRTGLFISFILIQTLERWIPWHEIALPMRNMILEAVCLLVRLVAPHGRASERFRHEGVNPIRSG